MHELDDGCRNQTGLQKDDEMTKIREDWRRCRPIPGHIRGQNTEQEETSVATLYNIRGIKL